MGRDDHEKIIGLYVVNIIIGFEFQCAGFNGKDYKGSKKNKFCND